jgi:uncharacterized protein (TIGR00369 family)
MSGRFPAPPMMQLMGYAMVEAEAGRVVFECQPAEFHYNPNGAVHGGMAATLLDSAMGCAIQSMLPAGIRYTTVELHVNYLRPLTIESGPVRCEGKTIHVGRQLAVAEGRIEDANGKLYAHGTTYGVHAVILITRTYRTRVKRRARRVPAV